MTCWSKGTLKYAEKYKINTFGQMSGLTLILKMLSFKNRYNIVPGGPLLYKTPIILPYEPMFLTAVRAILWSMVMLLCLDRTK